MSTEIYYFSGTGNSLFVARELQKRIPESGLLPIVSLLRESVPRTEAESVGIVFPVHALTIPIAVKRFIKSIDMRSAEYVFAVATRGGTVFRGFEKIDRLLKKKGRRLDSRFVLNMGHNELPRSSEAYEVPSEADFRQWEAVVLEKLDMIGDVVNSRSASREKDVEYTIESASNPISARLIEGAVVMGMDLADRIGGVNYFCCDDRCNGCGICEKVCLSTKIRMQDGRPTWRKDVLCFMCYACLNYCPRESVQVNDIPLVKSYTRQNGRYPHPYATAKEISTQKEPGFPRSRFAGEPGISAP